ncbi:hypothetical protein F5Y06DRAFT_259228 [Hypoxylon sp. FL0890]|nr:hypothetical protein F5Y06DRAFT_259228 [Hypoxylon sp. FL0890]
MVTIRWAFGAILAASAVSASTDELQFFARLLRRQDPGSPSYNCHDNCGQAIIQGRSSADVCHDDVFLTDYKACLQCAGPDNQDIWQYYGTTLTKDATPCGLSTTPLSGKQPDVGPVVSAGSGSSSAAQSTPSATSSATETSTAGQSSSEVTTAPSSTAEVTAPSSETAAPVSTGSSSGYATATATEPASVTSAVTTSYTPSGTSSASGSGNGTAPTSSGVVVVNNAGKFSGSSFGFYGALAVGAFYAVVQ